MKKAAFYTSGGILAVSALGHGVRLFTGFDMVVVGIIVPLWMSLPAMIIGALLAIWVTVGARRL
jgi:hypothetical protein